MECLYHSSKTSLMQCVFVMLLVASCVLSDSSSSSGAPPEKQMCGPTQSFCSNSKQCYAKIDRCANDTSKTACIQQTGCNQQDGKYQVTLTTLDLGTYCPGVDRSLFPKKEHWFVDYRGFSYEFGGRYGLQVLDTADPKYKYARYCYDRKLYTRNTCFSTCTQTDLDEFSKWWRWNYGNYRVLCNNCQDFGQSLYIWLCGSCLSPKRYVDGPGHPITCIGKDGFHNMQDSDNPQPYNIGITTSPTVSSTIMPTNFTTCDCDEGCTTCYETYCAGQSSMTATRIKLATYLATAFMIRVITVYVNY